MSRRNTSATIIQALCLLQRRLKSLRFGFLLLSSTLLGAVLAGCAVHRQVQYFGATDPETGVTNYYRLTVTGSGLMGVDYHLQAGYFSAAAVDVLRGSMPKIPVLDLPIEQMEVYDRLTSHFFAALIQEMKRLHNVTDLEAIYVATLDRRNNANTRLLELQEASEELQAEIEGLEQAVTEDEEDLENRRAQEGETCADVETLKSNVETAEKELTDAEEAEKQLAAAITKLDKTIGEYEKARKKADEAAAEAKKAEDDSADNVEELKKKAEEAKQAADELQANAEAAKEKRETKSEERDTLKSETLPELKGKLENALAALEPCEEINKLKGRIASRRGRIREAEDRRKEVAEELSRLQASVTAAETLLTQIAKQNADDGPADWTVAADTDPLTNDDILNMARMIWFGSLSSSDLASIGMTGHANPYQFRKLVYWATAQNIDLNQYAGEIDAILDNATNIAMSYKKLAEQRKAEKKARSRTVDKLLPALLGAGDKAEALKGLVELMNPVVEDDSTGGDVDAMIDLILRQIQEESSAEDDDDS